MNKCQVSVDLTFVNKTNILCLHRVYDLVGIQKFTYIKYVIIKSGHSYELSKEITGQITVYRASESVWGVQY